MSVTDLRFSGLMASEIYVYQEQGRILGFGAINGNEIRALFVHPEHRAKGIGLCMLEFLLACVEREPYLYVVSTNQPAKSLYQRYGFNVVDTFESTYNQINSDQLTNPDRQPSGHHATSERTHGQNQHIEPFKLLCVSLFF